MKWLRKRYKLLIVNESFGDSKYKIRTCGGVKAARRDAAIPGRGLLSGATESIEREKGDRRTTTHGIYSSWCSVIAVPPYSK